MYSQNDVYIYFFLQHYIMNYSSYLFGGGMLQGLTKNIMLGLKQLRTLVKRGSVKILDYNTHPRPKSLLQGIIRLVLTFEFELVLELSRLKHRYLLFLKDGNNINQRWSSNINQPWKSIVGKRGNLGVSRKIGLLCFFALIFLC